MAKNNIDLSSLQQSINSSVQEYSNIPIPDDITKLQASQILAREVKLVSDEEKRIFDQKMQEDRFELDKDHKYWSEKFEEKKLEEEKQKNSAELELKKEEQKIANKRISLDSEKQNALLEIEKTRLKYDELKLDLEKTNLLMNEKARKDDLMFKYISLGFTVLIPAIMSGISLFVSWRVYKTTLKFKYIDEGMPDKLLENASKSVNDYVKRYY